jgi:aryl-alcohol dehydrogenase-like predicted oxidoreductase
MAKRRHPLAARLACVTYADKGAVPLAERGALSGSIERHPIASPPPEPIGSAMSYDADVARAQRLLPLVKEGFAASLTEAATRFAISHSAAGTILVGMATPQQFEDTLAAVQKGPLPSEALDRLSGLQHTFAGEVR